MTKAGFFGGLGRGILVAAVLGLSGCSLSPDEKEGRVQVLKQQVQSFANLAVQKDWDGLFRLTDGSFDGPDKFEAYMTQPWESTAVLTGGNITSLSWVNNSTTKVKINWIFQEGSILSYSSESFVWVWKDDTWKLRGRVLR
ncbi:MAG TPA: hypothetical protein VMU88_11170 [bacterium]|nr:hypothetical protein [bacterium]